MTDRKVLKDTGKISQKLAQEHAETEFEKYRITQDRLFESDFDRFAQLKNEVDGKSKKEKKKK
ncbi:MAG: virulence RhuM family protein [Candidatus Moranbacteria bacterium]|nr:virulence RhuM family protein [Candidatus Moranbacteria bacterium]